MSILHKAGGLAASMSVLMFIARMAPACESQPSAGDSGSIAERASITPGTCTAQLDPRAVAIVRAFSIADRAIMRARWSSTITIHDAKEGEVVLASAQQGCDDARGTWYWRGFWSGRSLEDGPFERTASSYVGDRQGQVYAWSPDEHRGVKRPSDEMERQLYPGMDHLLGRRFDRLNHRTLAEILLDSERLELLAGDAADPVVRGITNIGGFMCEMTVRFDAAHSLLPSQIGLADALMRAPMQVTTINSWTRIGDLWAPSAGRVLAYENASTPEQLESLHAELSRRGVSPPDPTNAEHRERYQRSVKSVYGDAGVPVRPLGVGEMTVRITNIAVNDPKPDELMTPPGSSIVQFYDAYRLRPDSMVKEQPPGRMRMARTKAGADRADQPPREVNTAPVRIEALGRTEFEDLTVGTEVQAAYRIVNASDRAIKVRTLSKSCGCLSALLDKDTIEPGGQARYAVGTRVSPGSTRQVLHAVVRASTQERETDLNATLSFTTKSTIVLVPERLIACTRQGESVEAVVWLQERAGGELDRPVVSAEAATLVEVGEQEPVELGAVRKIRAVFPAPEVGRRCYAMRIRPAGMDQEMVVPVHVRAFPAIEMTPTGVIWTADHADGANTASGSDRAEIRLADPGRVTSVDVEPRGCGLLAALGNSGAGDKVVSVERPRGEEGRRLGSAMVVVRDAKGLVVAEIPVVWGAPHAATVSERPAAVNIRP